MRRWTRKKSPPFRVISTRPRQILDDAEEALALQSELDELETELALAEEALDELEKAAHQTELDAEAALQAAANKEVTEEVRAEVDRVLAEHGLLDGVGESGEATAAQESDTDNRRARGGSIPVTMTA
jgi:cell division septum initiation protein DivIVA